MSTRVKRVIVSVLLLPSLLAAPTLVSAAQPAQGQGSVGSERMIVVARSDASYDQLRQDVQRAGGSILKDMRSGHMLVVRGSTVLRGQLNVNPSARAVATDRIERIVPPSAVPDMLNASSLTPTRTRTLVDSATSAAVGAANARAAQTRSTDDGDPAFGYPGLMWSIQRIHGPEAWQITTGSPAVRVGVADTGLDYTHTDLQGRVADVVDFTTGEDPPICSSATGVGDADLARLLGGPENTDWNGHGSWIGGNIAAALNRTGVNGIAPRVKLVALKVSQWCGASYDSEILDSFLYAADHHIEIVNNSFGGYLDPGDPSQLAIYQQYVETVQYARSKGTLIVAAAGNDHVRVDAAGQVTSHGILTTAGDPLQDAFGFMQTPGGIPGVVDVSATGNVVAPSSRTCPPASIGSPADFNSAVCKPRSDPHQAAGQGKMNQLAYYSNYGPRIDVAGPGGARKFNLPNVDRGGTPGFPYTTDDLTTDFGDFGMTSNWAQQVPCFVFSGGGFPKDQCYSSIQGTSMSTPHAAGVAALIASTSAEARGNPARLEQLLKSTARKIAGNETQVLSATDTSPGDLSGVACPSGYCHLGGAAVPDRQAYGAGLVDARRAVSADGREEEFDDR